MMQIINGYLKTDKFFRVNLGLVNLYFYEHLNFYISEYFSF